MTRLALIGLGQAAREIYWPARRWLRDIQLCAGADPSLAAREQFARLAGTRVALYDEPAQMIDRERPDWVAIVTPPASHRELCLMAFARGVHVVCEKPFVNSVADADEVIAAGHAAGRSLVVNHQYPSMPIFDALRGTIGTPRCGRALFLQAWQHVAPPPETSVGWRTGGQTMGEFGSHVVDLAMFLFDAEPVAVTARMPLPAGPLPAGPLPIGAVGGGDPIDLVALDFPGDRVASIVLDRVCRGEHRYLEVRLDAEFASLRASVGGRARLTAGWMARARRPELRLELAGGGRAWLETGEHRETLARNPLAALAHATAVHLNHVIRTHAQDGESQRASRRARTVVATVAAAYESARTGTRIAIIK